MAAGDEYVERVVPLDQRDQDGGGCGVLAHSLRNRLLAVVVANRRGAAALGAREVRFEQGEVGTERGRFEIARRLERIGMVATGIQAASIAVGRYITRRFETTTALRSLSSCRPSFFVSPSSAHC